MAKKKSEIEKDSRITVATNKKLAQEAEIGAAREIEVKQAEKERVVGEKSAEKEQMIGVANEKAKQQIAQEAEETAMNELAVEKVRQVTNANIMQERELINAETLRKTTIIRADQDKEKMKIDAEAQKEKVKIDTEAVKYQTETIAEADKNAKEKEASAIKTLKGAEAEGIKAVGMANADAEKQMQLARVTAEITLAEKIGNNQGYQEYLVNLEVVKQQANVAVEQAKYNADVGKAQALNLNRADIKIITNTTDGNVGGGVSKVMDLFSPKGGTALSGMMEAFAQTDVGKSVLDKIGLKKQDD
jgi:flotillin